MGRIVAVIPARGGSQGIPKKNLVQVCGHPLVAWSIRQLVRAERVGEVYVSSDSDDILAVAERYGGRPIRRPPEISGSTASSESAWQHALDAIESASGPVSLVVAPQATSPIREPSDFDEAIATFERNELDSLFSCCELRDHFVWRYDAAGHLEGANHDWRKRRRRQDIEPQYLENGSFYLFKPEVLRAGIRLGGRIGLHVMAKHKEFQIDEVGDIALCEAVMRGFGLDQLP